MADAHQYNRVGELLLAGLLPAAAKRQEERNQIVGDLRFRLGERGVDLRGDALGVEDDLERLAPGLKA
jgi:hypothetical protein